MSNESKNEQITARVSSNERRVVEIAAEVRGQSITDFIRTSVLREASSVAAGALARSRST